MASFIGQIRSEIGRLVKTVALAAVGLLLIAAASLFSANPSAFFFKVLSLLGTGMLLVSVALMILTFRKASEVKPGALAVSLAITLVTVAVQLALRQSLPPVAAGGLALAAGMLLGGGWSRTRLFFVDGETIRCRGTAWYLAVWAGVFALNQLSAALAGDVPAAMTTAMLASSGIVAGSTGEQLLRFFQVQRRLPGRTRLNEFSP